MKKLLFIILIVSISFQSFALERYTVPNLLKQLMPAIVTITYNMSGGYGAVGSGVVVSSDGFIVTNYHVIKNSKVVNVAFNNGTKHKADVVNFDSKTDLAIIKIKGYNAFPFVYFGNSESLQVGEVVFAVGSPYGLKNSVSMGIISGKNRTDGLSRYQEFLQTDAIINPGNSGGPLFNLDGQLVGINTATLTPQGKSSGIGFAIPSNLVSKIVSDLKNNKQVQRASLGFDIIDITSDLKTQLNLSIDNGAVISKMKRNSPALAKGIRVGDVVTQLNGQYIQNSHQLYKMVSNAKIGQQVRIKIMRNNKIYARNLRLVKD